MQLECGTIQFFCTSSLFQMKPDFFLAQNGNIPFLEVLYWSSLLYVGFLHPWTWKGLYQMSPGTAGDRRMVIWLRQFSAFLWDLTDLIFTSLELELLVLSKLNFSQLITEYSVHPSVEIQTHRNADHAKMYIWRHWEVYFHNKNFYNSKYSGHLKEFTKLKWQF